MKFDVPFLYLYRAVFRMDTLGSPPPEGQMPNLSQSESITTDMFRTLANILLATAAATLCWQAASGVPARRGAILCTQPDGTTITVERMGDEHFHTFVTADDRIPVQRTADGQSRYLNPDGTLSSVAAHNPGTRTQAEAEFLRTNGGGADFATLSAAAAQPHHNRAQHHGPHRCRSAVRHACPSCSFRTVTSIFSTSRTPTPLSNVFSTPEKKARCSISPTKATAHTRHSSTFTAR